MKINNIFKKLHQLYLYIYSVLIFFKYKKYTMIPFKYYISNLILAYDFKDVNGDIVECGVWRGGMIAGIAQIIKIKDAHLFDSFEGLPEAKPIDGLKAINWQRNTTSKFYHNNCKAEIEFAQHAMAKSKVNYKCYKGWFETTLNGSIGVEHISILRLDCDWYDSIMTCLDVLYSKVSMNGLIIIDDYYTWEGCSKAVHDFLSKIGSKSTIFEFNRVAYIIKKD